MTDPTSASTPQNGDSLPTSGVQVTEAAPVYEWAPEEPARKKRHLGLWIGIPSGVVAVTAVVASLLLIAPGTAVAGVPVGGLTVGGAADALDARLAATTVEVETPEGVAVVTGADLGASVDSHALAEAAFAAHPMWNVTQWNSAPLDAEITVDPTRATEALRSAAGSAHVEPQNAVVEYDAETASYVTTPATPGEGIDPAAVVAALEEAFTSGTGTATVADGVVPVRAALTTEEAEATTAQLNTILDSVGFYVGDERVVPVERDVAASWLTVAEEDGQLTVSADADAIQAVVDTLPGAVDREPMQATAITNTSGTTLSEVEPGLTGRTVGDTSGVADAFAAQLAGGDGVYELSIEETEFETTKIARRIDVNLSTQRMVMYENDQVVQDWAISSGKAETPTPTGNFTIFAHVPMQDMGCAPGWSYCTEDVPWVTYFAPDIAFHGTYWHDNFGTPMSHGCINLPIWQAKYVYDFVVTGTEISVHY